MTIERMVVEECQCDSVAVTAADEDMEGLYLKRQEEGRSKKSPYLDKHARLFHDSPTSESICIYGASEHLKVGQFHEIDHSQLSPNSPVQLNSIRIVMVSDKGKNQVSLRYPSLQSLRSHFSDQNFGKPGGKKTPALDEKYVMGLEAAIKVLCRSITTEEFSQKRNSWNFWVSPSVENIQSNDNPVPVDTNAAVPTLVSKQGVCWSELKSTGLTQWGARRQVRFLGRHEGIKVGPLLEFHNEKGVSVENREGSISEKKRKQVGELTEAAAMAGSSGVVRMTRQCVKTRQNVSNSSGVQKSKKVKNDTTKKQLVVHGKTKTKRKISIDRWSAERYHLAEENMLKVMKEKGAVHGNPILRPDLRSEARKFIGDTGLLDHLLKHMAGKVAPGGAERFRRRHNAEGAMEYWLESADLVDIRKEAGVQDSYWTPPPGWKIGDTLSQDHFAGRELRVIKEEILKLKLEMRELAAKKGEEALAIVTTPSSCLSSLNWEDNGPLVSKEEIYVELLNKKAKIEEQLKEISLTLSGIEAQLGMLKPTIVEEPIMPRSVTPLAENLRGETRKEKKGGNTNKATEAGDKQMQESRGYTAEDKAAKIERLKRGFQIFKPQGSSVWQPMDVAPQVLANLDQHPMVPTPPSASSSTQPLPMQLPIPKPSSPVKPQAERRPVSSATLTYVTGPFSPHLSASSGTPGSKITTTDPQNSSSFNLNEAPL